MDQPITTVDFSEFGSKRNAGFAPVPRPGNEKRGIFHIAVIVVSFSLTVMLYVVAFKNMAEPEKPSFQRRPPVSTSSIK